MLPTVHSIEEAKDWFLQNSSGTLVCVRADGKTLHVTAYPDACAFYEAA